LELGRFITLVVKKEEFRNREEMILMFSRFLKTIVMAVTLMFVAQGCAIFVRDDDFHHYHHFRHGDWEHGHYSFKQTQVAENHVPSHGSGFTEARR